MKQAVDMPPRLEQESTAAHRYEFTAVSRAVRIRAGEHALSGLAGDLRNLGVQRAVLLCGKTVRHSTGLIDHIQEMAGSRIAGVFDGIDAGASRVCVEDASRFTKERDADALIAVGAGSVTKAARVVAIHLAEQCSLEDLATRYEGGRAHSVRLDAPKLPIINIITAATSSQNRAGSSIRDRTRPHQLEFFDPKTRARLIYWDRLALETAPDGLTRTAAAMEMWWGLMNVLSVRSENLLVQSSRLHVWREAQRLSAGAADGWDWQQRLDLCALAYLRTRDEDDGGAPLGGKPMRAHLLMRASYMLAVGLFNTGAGINQAVAMVNLCEHVIRVFGPLCPAVVREAGLALGMSDFELGAEHLYDRVAQRYALAFSRFDLQMEVAPANLRSEAIDQVISYSLQVFNCNADGLLNDKTALLREVLERALRVCAPTGTHS